MKEPTLFYRGGQATHSSNTAPAHGKKEGRKGLMLAVDPGASECIGEVLERCGFEPVLLSTDRRIAIPYPKVGHLGTGL